MALSMSPRLRSHDDDHGFTLIELLVVMIIIGVLAAIAIPAFLNQKAKAKETAVKSDLKQITKEVIGYYVDGSDALSLAAGPSSGWSLTDAHGQVVATGPYSPGNTTGAGSFITSADLFCVSVAPSGASGRAWHANPDGLAVGGC